MMNFSRHVENSMRRTTFELISKMHVPTIWSKHFHVMKIQISDLFYSMQNVEY